MSVSVLEAYRVEFARQAAKPVFIDQQTTGLTFGQYSQWFDLVPQTKPNVLATYVKFTWTVPAGGLTAQTNAQNLDVLLGQVQIAPSARVMPRSQTITRSFMSNVEQLTFDTNFYGANTYPRAAPTAAAGTYSAGLYIPVGGPAAALRFLLPSSTNAYTSGTGLVLNSITVYAIEGGNDAVIVYKENNTPSLGTLIQSVKNYIPDDIAPDAMVFVGDTSAAVTQLFLVDQNGQMLVAATDVDAVANGMVALTPRTGALGSQSTTVGGSAVINLGVTLQGGVLKVAQAAFASATTHDIGVIQFAGAPDVPENTPQETVAPPAVAQTGVQNAAGKPASKGDNMAGAGKFKGGPPNGSRFSR
jgi:hypothetical protein